ncbi:MAG TPA: coagulation factor 5/8 type domain-containing protein [Thermoanaerobaculia bacterium]|nr:coagulation factor 5/8 type domain-containing protein [Thermoanaerobaculia bacterium]
MLAPLLLAAALTWTPHPSDGVEMHLSRSADVNRLDFDFHGHGGYAIARARIDADLPPNYQIVFRIRGEAPPENLELKLLDESGDNVWWLNRRDFVFPRSLTRLSTKKRQIAFAWGPRGGGELARVTSLELVVTAGSGGRGSVFFSDPVIEALPPTPTAPIRTDLSTIDLGEKRELGGLIVTGNVSRVLLDGVALSPRGGERVPKAGEGRATEGGRTFIWLPDAEARVVSVPEARSIEVEPPSWAPTINDFWSIVAKNAPRGKYPRYLLGEQSYWTTIGADGAEPEALISEDGAVEPFKGGCSIEPFLIAGGRRLTWADVTITHSLLEGDLPIPTVTWTRGDVGLDITAAVSSSSMLQLRYRVRGDARLQLEVRPFQVNPSTQFLNLQGGYTPDCPDVILSHVDGEESVPSGAARDRYGSFAVSAAQDDTAIKIPLLPGARTEPLEQIADAWREKLRRVAIDVPADPRIAETIRTNIAYMLIHRDGAAFKPGSRSYDRAWIRDGALMASTLLRLGHQSEAKEFAEWYAGFQYPDGKVPCCVDQRGADPVPENDSHGEFIYLVAEIWRYTGDRALVQRLWPNVRAAARYINRLRSENHGQFQGLVTESISHEGYSAKPMHSYWDDFFALKGLEDAELLAHVVGVDETFDATGMRRDLAASIRRTIDAHHIDYVPGSAELGDFDATSTAIGISPLNLTSLLPPRELQRTFDRFLESLRKPRCDYTPYELRNIGALIRLGRDDAISILDGYLRDRRPQAWNGWAEAIRTEPRKPGFVGDMPHAWVASDYIRSILDAFAYDAEDGSIVVGAGVPRAWLTKPLHVGPLGMVGGTVDVRMRMEGGRVVAEVRNTTGRPITVPPGVILRRVDAEGSPDKRAEILRRLRGSG